MHFKETYNLIADSSKGQDAKRYIHDENLQGDKNAAFIIYVANSKQIPSAIGKKEMIFSNAFCTNYCLKGQIKHTQ